MFSSSPKIIVYLTAKSLSFKGEGISETETLVFLPENVKNLEVINRESFKTAIYTFLGKVDIKRQKIVFVLGEDLLFEKTVPMEKAAEVRNEEEKFLSELPFPTENVVCLTLSRQKEVYFVATNKDIYMAALEGFQSMGWKIQAVVPIFIFPDVRQKESITGDDVKKILKETKLLSAANFLAVAKGATPAVASQVKPVEEKKEEVKEAPKEEAKTEKKTVKKAFAVEEEQQEMPKEEASKERVSPVVVEEVVEEKKEEQQPLMPKQLNIPLKRKRGIGKFVVVGIVIAVIALLLFGGFTMSKNKHLPNFFAKPTPTAMPTPIPTATPTPMPSVAKKDLVIEVQNGTTIPGLAGKVKTALVELGYTNVTTGNADNQNATETTVSFSSKVSKDQQTEIVNSLKKTFSNVTVSATPPSGSVDVIIITASPS